MLMDSETTFKDPFGGPIDPNYECEFCERSVEGRFGGVPNVECDSCAADFRRLNKAGKLEWEESNA